MSRAAEPGYWNDNQPAGTWSLPAGGNRSVEILNQGFAHGFRQGVDGFGVVGVLHAG